MQAVSTLPLSPIAAVATANNRELPPPLWELPSQKLNVAKGHIIYRPEEPAQSLYLVLSGRVKLTRVSRDGRESVLDVLRSGEPFGEFAALGYERRQEQAAALDAVELRMWQADEVRRRLERDPRLTLWLARQMSRQVESAHNHIETLSFDPIPKRLARVILHHAERFGTKLQDGRIRTLPLTHEALAQQVATSREIITHYMNEFRSNGLLDYSRKSIDVVPDRLASVLA